ncbi:MAG: two-component regulator propeller domain-containing protein [Rhodothermales bacterium]
MNSLRHLSWLVAGVVVVAWGASVQVHAQDQPTLDPGRALSQYVLDVWTTDDGLPQNTIVSLAQTQDGYLWLGTQEGLVRFDGLHFTTYTQELPNPFVSALHEDATGVLWVGTYGGGLARYENGRFTSQTIDGVPDGHISAIASAADGSLWVGAFGGGLVRVSGEQTRTFATAEGAPTSGITALATDATGAVWIGTLTEGLVRFADGRFTRSTAADGLSADEVRSLHVAEDGSLWVATENGIDHIVRGQIVATPAAVLADDAPRTILSDTEGTLWVGTQQQGLVRLHDGRAERLTAAEGLPHDAISLLYEDLEGSLWIGTDGGLARLHGGRVVTYSTPEGLAHPVVLSVYEDAQGAVWMGTEGGGLARLDGNRITMLTTADGLPSDVVLAVRGTQDGSLWIGTHGGGLARLKNDRISTFTVADGLPSASVFALYEDRAGTLWFGTSNGLGRYRDGRFTTLTTADGLSNDLITVMTEDARGRLWAGTYEGGLNVLEGDVVVAHISTEDGLPSNLILSLHAGSDGVLWSGTQNGLSRIVDAGEGFAVHTFTATQGLQSSTVLQLLEDTRGWLWMSSNRGLSRVHTSDFEAVAGGERNQVTPTLYGRSDGLRSEEFNGGVQPAGWQGHDGALWFPTTDGVVAIYPEHVPDYPLASARIEGLLANGAAVDLGSADHLAPDRRRLTFRYAAPSFLAPERIRYRYQLEGVDEQWIGAGARREAFYTNLAPGDYTFLVQALNADGTPGPIASLPLRIEPYFYETGWFRALCVLTVLLLLRLIYGARIRFLKTRQRELEVLVETRTDELRRTNEQLAATSEMKTQLMHVVAHDLKNPLNGVHGLAQVLRDELPPDLPLQEFVHLIEKAAEEMLVMVIRFLDVEALDSQGNVLLAIERIDMCYLAHEAVERFQGQAQRKDQVLTFAPPSPADYIIEGDPAWLKEVFDNLVSNAVKYTPLGKRIHVRVAHREEDGRRYVRFEVQDEGPGLTSEDMDKLFERFQQLSAQPTAEESSTGLGLSIVKGIVNRHNGSVWAESEVGVGSTFIVEFEAAGAAPPSAPTADEPSYDDAVASAASEDAALTAEDDAWLYQDALVLGSDFEESEAKPASAPPAEPAPNAALDATFSYIG